MAEQNMKFSVAKPNSMVGSVLLAMKEFKKIGPGRYRFIGDSELKMPA